MKYKNKFKQVNIKIYMIPFFIIAIVFFVISKFTIDSINNYYYDHMKESSLNLAKGYSQNLSKATEATEVVNELLEEKMMVASRTTALYDGIYNNELLEELASTLEVDEIDYYNSSAELIYSNMAELIGWKAFEGHPVYNFMLSDSKSLIEGIRKDSITGNYYKYGYFKVSDGGFVQIGVKADEIYDFLGGFEMQKILHEMQEIGVVASICFIDNDYNVVGSTDNQRIGQKITDHEVKAAILDNKEYAYIANNSEKEYEVFVPVYLNDNKIGTLAIGQSLKNTENVVKQVSFIGLVILVIVYISMLYSMLSTYKKNKRLIQLAYYDPLTGLANKQYLKELLNEELKTKDKNKKALMLINCSNFRIANLTYGYEYGDELLKELGKKLLKIAGGNKKLFRFSADRFVLYIKNCEDQRDLVLITYEISRIFNHPFQIQDIEQNLSVQIGIVDINHKYNNFDRILKDATISLRYIKNNNSINYAFFNEEMESKLQREKLIEAELRNVISVEKSDHLYLEYQPLVELATNKIIGFEALARMKSDHLGFVSPLEFIEVAEKNQLMVPLGNIILRMACNFIRTIVNEGFDDIRVAVNISGVQLLRDDFTDTIMDIINETKVQASNLELEITETVLLDNYDIINKKLKDLRKQDIKIALDDFGTGYSSFSRLRELNIDIVKIDRYFISKIPTKEHKELITGDIISMAHKLNLIVVTEGIELQEQKDYLIENHCDIMQGYLFSKSLADKEAIILLKNNNTY